jgi:hypothetical protein
LFVVKESASRDYPNGAPILLRARDLPKGLIVRVGTLGHPCRDKSFRKAVSVVMDDLELYYSQLAPAILILINLCSKLAQLQQQTCNKTC